MRSNYEKRFSEVELSALWPVRSRRKVRHSVCVMPRTGTTWERITWFDSFPQMASLCTASTGQINCHCASWVVAQWHWARLGHGRPSRLDYARFLHIRFFWLYEVVRIVESWMFFFVSIKFKQNKANRICVTTITLKLCLL